MSDACPNDSDDVQCCIRDLLPRQACPRYLVIGVRGSGEDLTGANEIERMAPTVAAYVRAAGLPADTQYLSLPYRASPVGLSYFYSVKTGWELLQSTIRNRIATCPDIRIGLVGYSQGAHVINDAMSYLQLNARPALDQVRAVLQIADPRADNLASYHLGITRDGLTASRDLFSGGVLEPKRLPATIAPRSTSVCINGDLVCDEPDKGLLWFISAVNVETHGLYDTCCPQVPIVRNLGAQFANRLMQ